MALWNGIEMAVFAGDKDHAIAIHKWRIHAPLVAVGLIGVEIRVLKLPFDIEIGVELRDVKRAWPRRAERISRTVQRSLVVIVFKDDRVGAAVRIDRRRGVPAEVVRAREVAVRVKAEGV